MPPMMAGGPSSEREQNGRVLCRSVHRGGPDEIAVGGIDCERTAEDIVRSRQGLWQLLLLLQMPQRTITPVLAYSVELPRQTVGIVLLVNDA